MDKIQKDVLKLRRKARANWPPVFYYKSSWRPGYLKTTGRKYFTLSH